MLAQQHDPQVLPNGNVLVFDNGLLRRDWPLVFSRVLEIDRGTSTAVWNYRDTPPQSFFSPTSPAPSGCLTATRLSVRAALGVCSR